MSREKTIGVIVVVIALFVLVIMLVGVDELGERGSLSRSDTATTTDTDGVPGFIAYATSTELYEINAELPDGEAVGGTEVKRSIEQTMQEFAAIAESDVPSMQDEGFSFIYILDVEMETYETPKYISYVVMYGEYMGGANTNQRVESFVYDRAIGNEVSLEELILVGERDAFVASLRAQIAEETVGGEGSFLSAVQDLSFDDLDTFYVTDTTIGVLFSQYEVAPGAAGVVSVEVAR